MKAGATVIPAVDESIDYGSQEWAESHSGQLDVVGVGLQRVQPVLRFTTRNVGPALTAIGLNALALTAQAPGIFYWRKLGLTGPVAIGTAGHEKRTITSGVIVPMRIASGGTNANERAHVEYEMHPAGSDSGVPMTIETGQIIDASLPGSDRFYRVGPVVFVDTDGNYIVVPTQQWNMDFGWQMFKDGASGKQYDDFVGAIARAARFRITSRDMTEAAAMAATGTGLNWGASPITTETLPGTFDGLKIVSMCAYLRKLIPGGGPYDNSEAEHIELKVVSGTVMVATERGAAGGASEIELNVPVASDGSNPIVEITVDTAIVTAGS
jgi:hypothetical protein